MFKRIKIFIRKIFWKPRLLFYNIFLNFKTYDEYLGNRFFIHFNVIVNPNHSYLRKHFKEELNAGFNIILVEQLARRDRKFQQNANETVEFFRDLYVLMRKEYCFNSRNLDKADLNLLKFKHFKY